MFIKDMFFVHEHARKINLWQSSVIVSPFFGPLLAAFMIAKLAWYWPFVVYTIETAIALLLVILFVEETYYDPKATSIEHLHRSSRWKRLFGIAQRQAKQPDTTFLRAMMRPLKALTKPVILMTNAYYLITFAWAVGINGTLSQFLSTVYGFSPTSIGTAIFSQAPISLP